MDTQVQDLIDECVRLPVVFAHSGRYINIKDIKFVSRTQFNDEDGLMNALANSPPVGRVLWVKMHDDTIDAIPLSDLHNMHICNVPADLLNGYQSSSPDNLKGEDLVEYKIVRVWYLYNMYAKTTGNTGDE